RANVVMIEIGQRRAIRRARLSGHDGGRLRGPCLPRRRPQREVRGDTLPASPEEAVHVGVVPYAVSAVGLREAEARVDDADVADGANARTAGCLFFARARPADPVEESGAGLQRPIWT